MTVRLLVALILFVASLVFILIGEPQENEAPTEVYGFADCIIAFIVSCLGSLLINIRFWPKTKLTIFMNGFMNYIFLCFSFMLMAIAIGGFIKYMLQDYFLWPSIGLTEFLAPFIISLGIILGGSLANKSFARFLCLKSKSQDQE